MNKSDLQKHLSLRKNNNFKLISDEEAAPIFQRQRIDFDPPDSLVYMCVCNNQLIMGTSKNSLIKIDLDKQSSSDEIEIPKTTGDSIEKLHLDPTGFHLIVVMASGEAFYLHKLSRKPRQISKMRGHKITAVAWNNLLCSENSTGPILIGTSKGLLFEIELVHTDEGKLFSPSFETFNKQIYDFTRDKPRPITGLLFDKYPSLGNSKLNNYFLIVVVQGRLYQFIGNLNVQSEASMFASLFSDVPERFQDLPCSKTCSQITSYGPSSGKPPTKFAWLTDTDVFYGTINLMPKSTCEDVITEGKLISIHDDKDGEMKPAGLVLTAFHCLVLYPHRLKVYCLSNDKFVESDNFDTKFGAVCGLVCDPMKRSIWAHTRQNVFKYNVVEETREIWKLFLNKKEFELAKQFCPNLDKHREEILNLEADHLLSVGRYEECALLYAKSKKSFEEITLNLSRLTSKEPLKQFLKAKFNDIEPGTQLVAVIAWLVEIWMNEIGQSKSHDNIKFKRSQDEFRRFVVSAKAKGCITQFHRLFYNIILSHGNIEELVFVANLIHDHDEVIRHHIQQENFTEAIRVLSKQDDSELIYKYLTRLMRKNPVEMVDLLVRKIDVTEPIRVCRMLVTCEEGGHVDIMRQIVRYMEFCLKRFVVDDKQFHNQLISLYVKLKMRDELLEYLIRQEDEPESVSYDMVYALRLCAEHSLHEACIQIYTTMQLYNEAVDLALKTDVGLALDTASKPREDDDLQHKLWLKITRHMITEEGDIVKAMENVRNCDHVSIQDLLPYFPDFTTIEHFKDAICHSLKKYNDQIEEFKKDMKMSNEAVLEIQEQIDQYKNGYLKINKQKCSVCGHLLALRSFYIFPSCKHCFHLSCLVDEVLPHVSKNRMKYIEDLKERVLSASPEDAVAYKKKLDEAIGSECIYCGDLMIESIDKPLVSRKNYDEFVQSWL